MLLKSIACRLEHEDFFNALIETYIADMSTTDTELTTITFPQFTPAGSLNHFIKLDLSLRNVIFVGDNKMLASNRGKIGSGGKARAHLLAPLPVHLFDCTSLHEPATILDNIEWRCETLHNTVLMLCVVLNHPAKFVDTALPFTQIFVPLTMHFSYLGLASSQTSPVAERVLDRRRMSRRMSRQPTHTTQWLATQF